MKAIVSDGCGCFPTGRLYPGIAHLLRAVVRGLVEAFAQETAWHDIPIALIDVETTGRDASVDRVVEIGIVVAKHGIVTSRFNWLLNPGIPIPAEVSAIHGIKDEDVKDSPRFEAIAHEVAAALSGCVPGAYNAPFERAFIVGEFARTASGGMPAPAAVGGEGADGGPAGASTLAPALRKDVEWIDPLVWAREIQQGEKSRALGEVAARLGVKLENAHRASDDAEAAMLVLYSLAKSGKIPVAYGGLVQEQRRLALMHADERRRWRQFS
jgi:DNA polymerase-3 subunit epsilon